MVENSFYTAEFHGEYRIASIGRLELEEGGSIPDCLLAYTTFGELSAAKDNAILITTWFSGTHQIFRDVYVGPDHALDPTKYFIVVINQIGNGLSVSPHNAEGPNASIAMSKFPRVTIGDDVVAQERLLRQEFGITTLQLVTGGSMGAQQTYEWAVRFPDQVLRAAPIAGTTQITPHDELYVAALMAAIRSDPGWAGGDYTSNAQVVDGLKRHAGMWAVMGLSTEYWKQQTWRELEFASKEQFLAEFMEPYFTAMDPNDLLCMAWKWQHGDVSRHADGDLAAALKMVTARTFVMPIDEDMFFPVRDCRPEQEMVPTSELRVLEDVHGHMSLFGTADTFMPQVDRHLRDLLAAPG